MKSDNKVVGNIGEGLVVQYLHKKGYEIVERNFRTRFGELDIVCMDSKILVFVEVKTKKGHDFGEPEDMVNRKKLSQVRRVGEVYMLSVKFSGPCRVDVVAVVLNDSMGVESIRHHEAVY